MLRRFPLVWTGVLVVVACGVASGLTAVEGVRAGVIALQGLLFVVLGVAAPLARFAADDDIPGRVLVTSWIVIIGACLGGLAFPHDQGVDGTHTGVTGLLGAGRLSTGEVSLWWSVAWSAFGVCLVGGAVTWLWSRGPARRGGGRRGAATG